MKFKGIQGTSLIEYPGKISTIVWTAGCTFRCPFCYNTDLVLNPEKGENITEEQVLETLKERKGFVDAISVSGGEPTIHKDLPVFLKKVKDEGFLVELETNGTNPEMVKRLIDEKLVDYFAVDIKAPLEKYPAATCVDNVDMLNKISESFDLIIKSGIDHEFRTTVIPSIHKKEDIIEMAKMIQGAKAYYLQQFKVDTELVDPKFKELKPYSEEELHDMCESVKEYFDKCEVRS